MEEEILVEAQAAVRLDAAILEAVNRRHTPLAEPDKDVVMEDVDDTAVEEEAVKTSKNKMTCCRPPRGGLLSPFEAAVVNGWKRGFASRAMQSAFHYLYEFSKRYSPGMLPLSTES